MENTNKQGILKSAFDSNAVVKELSKKYFTPIEISLDVTGLSEIKLIDHIKKHCKNYDPDDVITDIQISDIEMNPAYANYAPRVNLPHTFNRWELPILELRNEHDANDQIKLFLNKEVNRIYLPENVFYHITMMVVLKHNFIVKPVIHYVKKG